MPGQPFRHAQIVIGHGVRGAPEEAGQYLWQVAGDTSRAMTLATVEQLIVSLSINTPSQSKMTSSKAFAGCGTPPLCVLVSISCCPNIRSLIESFCSKVDSSE